MARRRFPSGSSTGPQEIQAAVARTVAAHDRVLAAADTVSRDLDELSLGVPIECADDDSMVFVIERAQRRVITS